MTRTYLEENWTLSEYNEGDVDQLDYYINENRCNVGDKAFLYSHETNTITGMEIVNIISRNSNPFIYDTLISDDAVLINGEQAYNADTSAEFIADTDCYLVWFKYTECPHRCFMLAERTSATYKISKIIKAEERSDLRNALVQYCLDCGTGIEYSETNEDGSKNLTTKRERTEKPFKTIRYVHPETLEWFLSPEILPKTRYVLAQKSKGQHIDLINFDEWVAICNIFECPEMTYNDSLTINSILWDYEITPLDIDITLFSPIPRITAIMKLACKNCESTNTKSENLCCDCPLTKMKEKAEANNRRPNA